MQNHRFVLASALMMSFNNNILNLSLVVSTTKHDIRLMNLETPEANRDEAFHQKIAEYEKQIEEVKKQITIVEAGVKDMQPKYDELQVENDRLQETSKKFGDGPLAEMFTSALNGF